LNTVIIILHCLTHAENSRFAITAARLVAFPELNVVDVSDVGISAGERASSRVTLPGRRNAVGAGERADAESVFFVTIALAIVLGTWRVWRLFRVQVTSTPGV
jgi:hypothetical protein